MKSVSHQKRLPNNQWKPPCRKWFLKVRNMEFFILYQGLKLAPDTHQMQVIQQENAQKKDIFRKVSV